MSDWIELNIVKDHEGTVEPLSIRAYLIESVVRRGAKGCTITLDSDAGKYYQVDDPYEDVMKRIKEVESPVDLSNCVVEHFTLDEYDTLLVCVREAVARCEEKKQPHGALDPIIGKLKEILEDDDILEEDDNE